MPQQRIVRNDIFRAEQHLTRVAAEFGKSSMEYQEALRRFAQLWSVLRMTRAQDEFLHDILQ